jgi:gluconokinase
MPQLPRSPYDAVGGLVYFPRMVQKIRLRAAGELPEGYHPFLGDGFDGRCVRFLGVEYAALREKVLAGRESDEELLEWCYAQGRRPTGEEIEVWSHFARKRGWRDEARERIDFRLKEAGMESRRAEVGTMFDFIDWDEGRTPPDFSKWEPPRK